MHIDATHSAASPCFLGINFSELSLTALAAQISTQSSSHAFSYVVTPNVDHIVKLKGDAPFPKRASFQAAYDSAAFTLCDSRILGGLARLFGYKLVVVPGSDLTATLFNQYFSDQSRIVIVGGRADMLTRLKNVFPGPDYQQHIPPMGLLDNEEAMRLAEDFVCDAKSNYVLFAIGAPQSEILAHRCLKRGTASGIGLCIGASIEFLLGDQARAPLWMQNSGLEWAFRLASNPQRLWRRYLVEGPRIFAIVAKWRYAGWGTAL